MSGKLIVIESGTDASGKETQTRKLYNRLSDIKGKVRKIEYPNYESASSALIKMYLNGEFGENPGEVNTYAASTFYAVDRFASFQKEWKDFYNDGGIIIADRYTTSNMVHQASKFANLEEKRAYLNWLWEFEFDKFGLPVPDAVIFLDMPPEESKRLMKQRKNNSQDIHEENYDYLVKSYNNACWVAEEYNWQIIDCLHNGKLRSIEDIHNQIYNLVINLFES
ncbi:thymidylate kinase [Halobacteroides halobius DSM 5150]|uniref:Thymidylate kinase n=1 Tax=Halobacteroides halobius (strain ATCC 35273 / DSM 5150 / MD-1) TaxID=748449 RepID=L0K6B5_HALHC|nr:deoxynucleoside kinase [Halobacteroides halobius]AGB40080.1 thymidylate kinase [Halobacteroides halobius DSM 5150]